MNQKLKVSVRTFAKYMLWSGAAAAIDWAARNYAGWHIPSVYLPLIGGLLKAAASWVATRKEG